MYLDKNSSRIYSPLLKGYGRFGLWPQQLSPQRNFKLIMYMLIRTASASDN